MAKDLENVMTENNIYLLTQITSETTNGLIMQLSHWVNALPVTAPKQSEKIYSPYEQIPNNIPVLNVWINSGGGSSAHMTHILNLFNIASAHGTIIKTYNMSQANSCASMIAVSGTKGYRYMGEDASNLVHYGTSRFSITHPNELNAQINDFNNEVKYVKKIYSKNSKLTENELNRYLNIEGSGRLSAKQCLNKGLCDWVITNDGRFVNSVAELKKQNQR